MPIVTLYRALTGDYLPVPGHTYGADRYSFGHFRPMTGDPVLVTDEVARSLTARGLAGPHFDEIEPVRVVVPDHVRASMAAEVIEPMAANRRKR